MAPHGCFIKALYPKSGAQRLLPATEGSPISRSTMLNSRPVPVLPRHTNIVVARSVEAITEKFDISSDCGASPGGHLDREDESNLDWPVAHS